MRKVAKRKIRKIIACLVVIAVSPVLAALIIKAMPSISVFAGKIVNLSAGITLGERIPTGLSIDSKPPESYDEEENNHFDDSFMLSVGNPSEPSKPVMGEVERDGDLYIGALPYPENIDNNCGKITSLTYLEQEGTQFFSLNKAGQVRNATDLDNEVLIRTAEQTPQFRIEAGSKDNPSEPQVLIMHTHTTESFEPYARDFYDSSFNSRTTQENMNVIAVGNEIAKQIEEAGIGVIHDTTIHDYPSYNGSYGRSRITVKALLDKYPSIKVVLDIHRDAIEREGGERIAPVTVIDGRQAAQIMIISGCDNGTMDMPDYLENFKLASLFQQQIESDNKTLTRPVLFAYKKYNQDLTTGSLLIEVGGHANSIDQAVYAGELAGKSIAKALLELT